MLPPSSPCKKLAGDSTTITSLPDDLISEILSWLPVKAACRSRCVSRGWRALISSPAFLAMHRTRMDPLLLSVTASAPYLPEISSVMRLMDIDGNIVREVKKEGLHTINYCFNGPICVCVDDGCYVSVVDYYTRNVVRTSVELNHDYLYDLTVGCAVPSGTYKVVCLMSKYDPSNMVLTLEDGANWRKVQSPTTPSLSADGYRKGSPVTVNGVMHFMYNSLTQPQNDDDYVHRFDLETEEWKDSIKGPTTRYTEHKWIGKLDDALHMVQRSSTNECLIWVLTDSAKGTWVKMYTIPMAPNFYSLTPLTVMRDGRKLLFYARDRSTTNPTLHVYDRLTGTWSHLSKFASNPLGNNAGLCVLNLEYFVSPKISPIPSSSVLSQLISFRWLRRLNPLSHFYQ